IIGGCPYWMDREECI
nr:Chain P, ZAP 2.3 [synthetic construct]